MVFDNFSDEGCDLFLFVILEVDGDDFFEWFGEEEMEKFHVFQLQFFWQDFLEIGQQAHPVEKL